MISVGIAPDAVLPLVVVSCSGIVDPEPLFQHAVFIVHQRRLNDRR